ncbi:MAG: hypothetical protein AAF639_47355, partial [Chloroflexota bacterium]
AGLLTIGTAPFIYADLYDTRFFREDVADLATWLRETTTADDVIFVDQRYPFGFYYDNFSNRADIEPVGDEQAVAQYLFVDINTIDQRLNEWAADAQRVFWVQWFESDTDPRRSVHFLLDKEGNRDGERSFQGYRVEWWTLTPPTQFKLANRFEPVVYRIPPMIETVEVAFPTEPVLAGESIDVVIRWQRVAHSEINHPLKARIALYNGEGARLLQRDERILNDRHLLPAEWSMDDQPLNVYNINTTELASNGGLPTGTYTVRLLVYDAETLDPFGIVNADGQPVQDFIEADIATIQIKSE